jgi:GT2 family glycosyltransferase
MRALVVILNWNGWPDTLECLESVFRSDHSDLSVVVCDNASTDGSIAHLKAWAEGRLDAIPQGEGPVREATAPPVPKPIRYLEIDEGRVDGASELWAARSEGEYRSLTIIQLSENRGFAGGNNIGLRYALSRGDIDFVWLLNNDTVVRSDALSRMIERLTSSPRAGICGSTRSPQRCRLWAASVTTGGWGLRR